MSDRLEQNLPIKAAFQKMKGIWIINKELSLNVRVLKSYIEAALEYNSESWNVSKQTGRKNL